MAVILTPAFQNQLKQAENSPDVIIEMWLNEGIQEAIDSAFDYDGGFTDVTASLNSIVSDVQLFVANGDILFIGMSNKFTGLFAQLVTPASDDGITPTFEYSAPGATWVAFTPSDTTKGFRNNGVITWAIPSLSTWSAGTVNSTVNYWVRITRGASTLTTPPTEDKIQILHSTKLGTKPSYRDVRPVLGKVGSLQNKIDTGKGFTTRGNMKFTIKGRENFRSLIKDNFLKNRRVARYDGFIADGFAFEDYAPTFSGIISSWSRKGDDLTITVSDDLNDGSKKIPVELDGDIQFTDYSNMNPVDIMQDLLLEQLEIDSAFVDSVKMDSEQATWLASFTFQRVLVNPTEATKYLSQLQVETNSFLYADGEKISLKVFAPPIPGATVPSWADRNNIIADSLSQESGYKDQFFNRVVVYFDYDESGSDGSENFETVQISSDTDSQSSVEWDETTTKTIKSRWIKTYTFIKTANITGVTAYHASKANGAGAGTLTYTNSTNTVTWTAPSGTVGATVELSADGKYDIFDADENKFIRIVVDTASLPGSDQVDTITLTDISGDNQARSLANKLLSRYKNPAANVTFDIDINNILNANNFLKITDIVDLTTDEASEKGDSTWVDERLMITSMRPDFINSKIKIQAAETKMYVNYAFISPSTHILAWDDATPFQKTYGFIGNAVGNTLGVAKDDGWFVW